MPFWGRQEQNASVHEIVAGYGRHGDQWVKYNITDQSTKTN